MNSEKICQRATSIVFIVFISAFTILIMSQFVIKNVFIEMLNMDNAITKMSVTGGSDGMVDMNWQEMYPFDPADVNSQEVTEGVVKKENALLSKAKSLIKVIDKYSSDYLPFKENLKVFSGIFDKIIDNRMVDPNNVYIHTGKDGLIVRSPFYQEFTDEELNTTKLEESVLSLNDFLSDRGIDLLYVQAPIKEDKYDADYVGEYGLSLENRLADNLLDGLKAKDVDVLDLRLELKNSGKDCYDSFFVTDNHWTIDTAFWATGVLAEKLNKDYDFRFDISKFNVDNYTKNVYPKWVQGTIGRGVTLVNADYDDINVFVPNFETNLTMKIPNLNMNKTGSYLETMINPVSFERRSTVYHGAYDAFAYSKPPITEVVNNLEDVNDTKSVMLIRESFAGPVITYLSLGIHDLYAVTPEGFTGSIKSYIEEVSPDMVVILYTAPTTNEITSKYDFR